MGRSFGFVMLIVVMGAGAYLYTQQARSVSHIGGTASSVIDIVGISNDLMAMADAERRYFVVHSKYASLDELGSNGDIPMPTRPYYTYSGVASETSFKISATYSGPDPKASKHFSVDETMSVKID